MLYVFIVNGIKLSVKGRTCSSNFRNRYTITHVPDEIQYVSREREKERGERIIVAIICSHQTTGILLEAQYRFLLYFVKYSRTYQNVCSVFYDLRLAGVILSYLASA